MAIYGRNTIGAAWVECEFRRRGRSITLTGAETAVKISAYLRTQGTASNGLRCTLYNDSDDTLAYQSSVLAGFTDTTGAWRDFTFASSVAAGTYWLTIFVEGIAGGGNTVQIANDVVADNAALYESWFNDAQVWPTQSPDLTGLEAGEGNGNDVSIYLETASGGTVNTNTLTSNVDVADAGLPSKTSGRLAADTLTIADAGLDYVFYSRLGSDSVTVTDGPMEFYNVYGIVAISELTVSDEFVAWLRRNRLLEDNILVTDELISSLIGYLIFSSILTSNVSVTDQALDYVYFNRLLESALVTTDQILRALLVVRDLLDGVEVTDSGLTAMQRFILLTDTLSVEDALTALYVPETGPATDNPVIRIGFDQPGVMLGGYSVN